MEAAPAGHRQSLSGKDDEKSRGREKSTICLTAKYTPHLISYLASKNIKHALLNFVSKEISAGKDEMAQYPPPKHSTAGTSTARIVLFPLNIHQLLPPPNSATISCLNLI